MAKQKTSVFFCSECGYESSKWMGQCPACHAWNTMVEEPAAPKAAGRSSSGRTVSMAKAVYLKDVELDDSDRYDSGLDEFNRVLGGGIVRGSLVLVGGDPGIGKSTILLQVCGNLAKSRKKVLYISGEESLKQIKMRANRIGDIGGDLKFLCETDLDDIAAGNIGIGADRAVRYNCDEVGTNLNYQVLSEAVMTVRHGKALGSKWKADIEADYQTRGQS